MLVLIAAQEDPEETAATLIAGALKGVNAEKVAVT